MASGSSPGGAPVRRKLESPYVSRFADSIRLMRQHAGPGPATAGPGVAAGIARSRGEGSPLPAGVRRFMEPRFGADFSRVRIHTGEKAARLNRQVAAQAFTA